MRMTMMEEAIGVDLKTNNIYFKKKNIYLV